MWWIKPVHPDKTLRPLHRPGKKIDGHSRGICGDHRSITDYFREFFIKIILNLQVFREILCHKITGFEAFHRSGIRQCTKQTACLFFRQIACFHKCCHIAFDPLLRQLQRLLPVVVQNHIVKILCINLCHGRPHGSCPGYHNFLNYHPLSPPFL